MQVQVLAEPTSQQLEPDHTNEHSSNNPYTLGLDSAELISEYAGDCIHPPLT